MMEREATGEMGNAENRTERRRLTRLTSGRAMAAAIAVVCVPLYLWYTLAIGANPPGFYTDESAMAYNAYLISQSGRDLNGDLLPVYTPFFGGAMNMPYIYLLASVFAVSGPEIMVARLVSASLGFAAALLLGLLAFRLSGRPWIGIVIALSAMLTPQLFEVGRLVFEVATYPLALALLLLAVHRAHRQATWSWPEVVTVAASLALVTYAYSIGLLLGSALALGLIVFMRTIGWQRLVATWLAFGIFMIPAIVFNATNPGWLTGRFLELSFLNGGTPPLEIVARFIGNYISTINPISLLLEGDLNERHHVAVGVGAILLGTFVLALIGIARLLQQRGGDNFWRFVLIGAVLSVVPAALTSDSFHALRSIPLPVFLLMLAVPGLEYLARRAQETIEYRAALAGLIVLVLAQGAFFQLRFHDAGLYRGHWLDIDYPEVFAAAVETGADPIYLVDHVVPGHIHAYWYGTLEGVDPDRFTQIVDPEALPPGSIVISSEEACNRCEVLIRAGFFMTYRVQ